MYVPPYFKEKDVNEIKLLIQEFSFATLVSVKDSLPWATHIPLALIANNEEPWILQGHIARANLQWKNFKTINNVLAIFMGPHSYISPSWYNHKNVPTWNYRAVHLYGKVTLVEGEKLEAMLNKMMAHYEAEHADKPQGYNEIPPHTLEKDLRGIVGFEIEVERIEAASKFSQNRDSESHSNIIEQLKKADTDSAKQIATEMEKRKPK